MTLKQFAGASIILFLVAFDYVILIPAWNGIVNGVLSAFPSLCMKGGGCLSTYAANSNYALQAVILAIVIFLFIFTIIAPWIHEPDTGQLPMGGGYRAWKARVARFVSSSLETGGSLPGVAFDIAGFFVTLFIFAMIWIPLNYIFTFVVNWANSGGYSNEYLFLTTMTSIMVWWPMVILISAMVALFMGAQKRRLQEI